eukprot:2441214-Amphidinium_carterae.1
MDDQPDADADHVDATTRVKPGPRRGIGHTHSVRRRRLLRAHECKLPGSKGAAASLREAYRKEVRRKPFNVAR